MGYCAQQSSPFLTSSRTQVVKRIYQSSKLPWKARIGLYTLNSWPPPSSTRSNTRVVLSCDIWVIVASCFIRNRPSGGGSHPSFPPPHGCRRRRDLLNGQCVCRPASVDDGGSWELKWRIRFLSITTDMPSMRIIHSHAVLLIQPGLFESPLQQGHPRVIHGVDDPLPGCESPIANPTCVSILSAAAGPAGWYLPNGFRDCLLPLGSVVWSH
mmetsp:Transcript_8787/g.25302  ORF Transcript_8787/g.25302 Transcript_8787/m.25302 type:complete len:212 (+) Transcript_8787:509-1144(+)